VNKDSYLVLETLPAEFDSRVKAMEVDEKPTEDYSDIGGCDKQIQELIEAVVLPMTHKDLFDAIGVRPPKGVRDTRERAPRCFIPPEEHPASSVYMPTRFQSLSLSLLPDAFTKKQACCCTARRARAKPCWRGPARSTRTRCF
jgi:hypothetical protein